MGTLQIDKGAQTVLANRNIFALVHPMQLKSFAYTPAWKRKECASK